MKEEHTHITVMRTGLIVHEDLSFLATSPDGIVQCTHCQPSQGLLEVKCPSVHRNDTPAQACEDKSFFCEAVNGTVTLKRNHNYFHQVQGQMGDSGRKWCDFVVWTLKGMSVERIKFDEQLWERMFTKLKTFYTGHIFIRRALLHTTYILDD